MGELLCPTVFQEDGSEHVEIGDEYGIFAGFDPTAKEIGAALADSQGMEGLSLAERYGHVARVTLATAEWHRKLVKAGEDSILFSSERDPDNIPLTDEAELAELIFGIAATGRPWRATTRTTDNELEGEQ